MKFVHGSELACTVRDVLVGQRSDMAVAFWGKGASARLAIPRNANGSRVACDARSGSCNPVALAELLKRVVAIRDVPGLHAKVYIGEKAVVICSANASANGLGEEGDEVPESLEAGYVTERCEDIREVVRWFETIYAKGDPVTEADLPTIRERWQPRRAGRPIRSPKAFLDTLRNWPGQLCDRHLKVAIYVTGNVPPSVERKYKQTPFYNPISYEHRRTYPFFYSTQDWDIHEEDLILCFEGEEPANIKCEGVWRVQEIVGGGDLVPLKDVPQPLGLKFPQPDKQQLAMQVRGLVGNNIWKMNGPLIAVEDFVRALSGATTSDGSKQRR